MRDGASLGELFVSVACLLKGFSLSPVTDSSNAFDLEFGVDFINCPYKVDQESVPVRRLANVDGTISFSFVAESHE